MTWSKTTKLALPLLVLTLSACAHKSTGEPVLAVRPSVSKCPAFPTPPEALMQRPVIVDFLSTSD